MTAMAALPEEDLTPLHPVIDAAARGKLPDWTMAGPGRRKHMARVAKLMENWAEKRGESPRERARWIALGYLHDALREADEELMRPLVEPRFRELPMKILHGPAVAQRLRGEGVEDEEFLHAAAFHTLGSADFAVLGKALFAADFLEPGRKLQDDWRAKLRKRAPGDLNGVVKEILLARIRHLLARGRPLRVETVAFWNRFCEGDGWASASEL
jgi:HD superfamily phosphohydrolase YqeK